MNYGPVQHVIDRHLTELIQVEGVVAVGYSDDDDAPYIVVSVEELTEEHQRVIPADLEGYRVQIEETGRYVKEAKLK